MPRRWSQIVVLPFGTPPKVSAVIDPKLKRTMARQLWLVQHRSGHGEVGRGGCRRQTHGTQEAETEIEQERVKKVSTNRVGPR
jgi:hypothetical protein